MSTYPTRPLSDHTATTTSEYCSCFDIHISRCWASRCECQQVDLYTDSQELQDEEARVEGSGSSASRPPAAVPAAERRERATISARLENAVVPELGALAARCSRLVGQASLVFGK